MKIRDLLKHRGEIRNIFFFYILNGNGGGISFKKVLLSMYKRRRKILCLYGQCHMGIYEWLLNNNHEFRKKYVLLNYYVINELKNAGRISKSDLLKEKGSGIWDNVDCLIYNPGRPDIEGTQSISEIFGYISKNAEVIRVTNAAFKGYMPQHTDKSKKISRFRWGDKNLNNYAERGLMEVTDVIKLLKKEDYYSDEFLCNYFDKNVKKLEKYEEFCDIGIADFVNDKGRTRLLYDSTTHPGRDVMFEIGNRILIRLGIRPNDIEMIKDMEMPTLWMNQEIVYPAVYSWLGIKVDECYRRRIWPGHNRADRLDFEQYVYEYICDR